MGKPARSDRSDGSKPKTVVPKTPVVSNAKLQARLQVATTSPHPVRTIVKVEIGEATSAEFKEALGVILAQNRAATPNHPVYVCPMRKGMVISEPIFEAEVLEFCRGLCEIRDGEIVLKGSEPVVIDRADVNLL